MKDKTILIVEDDLISATYLEKICTKHDLKVLEKVTSAQEALSFIKHNDVHLILMDIMIEGQTSGCELAMKVRNFNKEIIIIFITAYSSEEMITYALDANAYSYLLKPYRDVEIISTIKMAFKVPSPIPSNEHIIKSKNGFVFHTKTKQLFYNSQEIFLSKQLHSLIEVLFKHRGSCVSYSQLSQEAYNEDINISTLRSHIHRLKEKLQMLEIHAVSKIGYVLY